MNNFFSNNFSRNVDPKTNRVMVNDSAGTNRFLSKMYGWMTMAIVVSALVAYYTGAVLRYQLSGGISLIVLIAWFVLPFIMGRKALKNPTVGIVELMVFAGLTGLMFSDIFLIYTGTTITAAFVASAGDFAAMSLIGATTKRSLAKLGTQLFGALIGLIVAMVVNIFLKSSPIALFISFAAVVIFSLLAIFDTRQMKDLYNRFGDQVSMTGLAINGALNLYLDFINIFLNLIEIFGGFGNNNR